MNIKKAKEQIANAIKAYFTKDKFGNYVIPIEKQRPIFLLGAPGIGKTAIMEQVASELGIGLVSYSMTHHTRQSALGLPFIEKKSYGGKEYNVSEYTMSEIIASVYDMIEETGYKEGILFLDEINCVSETLAPAMLQFLQYKIFGRHRVPDGWLVVTAGNPPEYNNSVREFDIVTWDRLKKIEVEPDFAVWKEYALNSGTHPAIITYLEIKHDDFYKIETTVDGKNFVTARGWSDLSDMIKLYEQHGVKVDGELVSQYLQHPKISRSFAIYYDLFNKYKSDYQVDKILDGTAGEDIHACAKNAKFDERLAFLGLLIDAITSHCAEIGIENEAAFKALAVFKQLRALLSSSSDYQSVFEKLIVTKKEELKKGIKASALSNQDIKVSNQAIKYLEDIKELLLKEQPENTVAVLTMIKKEFDTIIKALDKKAKNVSKSLSNAFNFCDIAFGSESQECLIFVTELTLNHNAVSFISCYGCPEYFTHNKQLLFYERQKDIIKEFELLETDE